MEKKVAVRNYNIADATLVVTGNSLLTSARRDSIEFALRSYTEVKDFAPMALELDAFADLPSDEELRGIQETATTAKSLGADNVKVKIREIMTAVENIYSLHSGEYRRFGTKGMNSFNDAELVKCGRRVSRTTTAMLVQMAPQGITAATATALLAAVNSFESEIDDQLDAINDRDIATEGRIVMGNAIYAKLVKIANTGKNIWVTTNEAKHNDYVIYDAPAAAVVPVPPTV